MADYLVRFVGTLVEGTRPSGFPETVYSDVLIRAPTMESLKDATNEQFERILRTGELVVKKDPTAIAKASYEPDVALFIPIHMFAFIGTKTTKLVQDIDDVPKFTI